MSWRMQEDPKLAPFKKFEIILKNKLEPFAKKIESLIEIWKSLGQCNQHNSEIGYIIQIIDWAKLHTLNIVLTAKWKMFKADYETKLLSEVEKTQLELTKISDVFSKKFQKLADVIKNPWDDPVLSNLLHDSNAAIGQKEIDFFCVETAYLVSVRLKKLCESQCEDLALNLVTAFMNCYNLSQTQSFNLNAAKSQILFCFDIHVALLYRYTRRSEIVELFKKLTLEEGLYFIRRFAKKRVKISKVWRNYPEITFLASQVFVTAAVTKPIEESGAVLKELLEEWIAFSVEHSMVDNVESSIRRIIQAATAAQHIYICCRTIHDKFGLKLRAFIIELYIRALTTDMNNLESQKTDNDAEKVEETTKRLANGFYSLADILKENIEVSRECALTAFSLNPTLERLRKIEELAKLSGINVLDTGQIWECKLHPPVSASDDICWICNSCGKWMSKPKLDLHLSTNFALHEALNSKTLGISSQLCDDLAVLLSGPRYQLLSWLLRWKDLHRLCEMYLNDMERTKNLVTDLKFVDIDYSMFEGVKREPVDEMAGIERGYERFLYSDDKLAEASCSAEPTERAQAKTDPNTLKSLRMFRPNVKRSKPPTSLTESNNFGENSNSNSSHLSNVCNEPPQTSAQQIMLVDSPTDLTSQQRRLDNHNNTGNVLHHMITNEFDCVSADIEKEQKTRSDRPSVVGEHSRNTSGVDRFFNGFGGNVQAEDQQRSLAAWNTNGKQNVFERDSIQHTCSHQHSLVASVNSNRVLNLQELSKYLPGGSEGVKRGSAETSQSETSSLASTEAAEKRDGPEADRVNNGIDKANATKTQQTHLERLDLSGNVVDSRAANSDESSNSRNDASKQGNSETGPQHSSIRADSTRVNHQEVLNKHPRADVGNSAQIANMHAQTRHSPFGGSRGSEDPGNQQSHHSSAGGSRDSEDTGNQQAQSQSSSVLFESVREAVRVATMANSPSTKNRENNGFTQDSNGSIFGGVERENNGEDQRESADRSSVGGCLDSRNSPGATDSGNDGSKGSKAGTENQRRRSRLVESFLAAVREVKVMEAANIRQRPKRKNNGPKRGRRETGTQQARPQRGNEGLGGSEATGNQQTQSQNFSVRPGPIPETMSAARVGEASSNPSTANRGNSEGWNQQKTSDRFFVGGSHAAHDEASSNPPRAADRGNDGFNAGRANQQTRPRSSLVNAFHGTVRDVKDMESSHNSSTANKTNGGNSGGTSSNPPRVADSRNDGFQGNSTGTENQQTRSQPALVEAGRKVKEVEAKSRPRPKRGNNGPKRNPRQTENQQSRRKRSSHVENFPDVDEDEVNRGNNGLHRDNAVNQELQPERLPSVGNFSDSVIHMARNIARLYNPPRADRMKGEMNNQQARPERFSLLENLLESPTTNYPRRVADRGNESSNNRPRPSRGHNVVRQRNGGLENQQTLPEHSSLDADSTRGRNYKDLSSDPPRANRGAENSSLAEAYFDSVRLLNQKELLHKLPGENRRLNGIERGNADRENQHSGPESPPAGSLVDSPRAVNRKEDFDNASRANRGNKSIIEDFIESVCAINLAGCSSNGTADRGNNGIERDDPAIENQQPQNKNYSIIEDFIGSVRAIALRAYQREKKELDGGSADVKKQQTPPECASLVGPLVDSEYPKNRDPNNPPANRINNGSERLNHEMENDPTRPGPSNSDEVLIGSPCTTKQYESVNNAPLRRSRETVRTEKRKREHERDFPRTTSENGPSTRPSRATKCSPKEDKQAGTLHSSCTRNRNSGINPQTTTSTSSSDMLLPHTNVVQTQNPVRNDATANKSKETIATSQHSQNSCPNFESVRTTTSSSTTTTTGNRNEGVIKYDLQLSSLLRSSPSCFESEEVRKSNREQFYAFLKKAFEQGSNKTSPKRNQPENSAAVPDKRPKLDPTSPDGLPKNFQAKLGTQRPAERDSSKNTKQNNTTKDKSDSDIQNENSSKNANCCLPANNNNNGDTTTKSDPCKKINVISSKTPIVQNAPTCCAKNNNTINVPSQKLSINERSSIGVADIKGNAKSEFHKETNQRFLLKALSQQHIPVIVEKEKSETKADLDVRIKIQSYPLVEFANRTELEETNVDNEADEHGLLNPIDNELKVLLHRLSTEEIKRYIPSYTDANFSVYASDDAAKKRTCRRPRKLMCCRSKFKMKAKNPAARRTFDHDKYSSRTLRKSSDRLKKYSKNSKQNNGDMKKTVPKNLRKHSNKQKNEDVTTSEANASDKLKKPKKDFSNKDKKIDANQIDIQEDMNPRVVLERLPLDSNYVRSVLSNVPGLNDYEMMRPSNVNHIVNVVQISGGRSTSTVPVQNTQTSTQITPHIQRIGQPRSDKPEHNSNVDVTTTTTTTPPSTSAAIKPTTSQPSTLINILSQQIIRPGQSNCVRNRTSPLINILSQQIIKPATTQVTKSANSLQVSETQSNNPKVVSTTEQANQEDLTSIKSTTAAPKSTTNAAPSGQGTILQFICKSTLPKFQQAFGKSVYQNNAETSETSTTSTETVSGAETTNKKPAVAKNSSVNIQPIQGGVIYTRQMPVGQTINLIPPGRGQVFRIATSNSDQISLVKDTVIHSKMSALLAAALQGKQKNSETQSDGENTSDESGGTRVTVTRPTLVQNARIVKPVLQIPSNVIRTSPQSNLSSTTLEQLREFDMVYKQITERSSTSNPSDQNTSEPNETSQRISVTYLNQGQKYTQLSPVVVVSSYCNLQPAASPALSVTSQGSSSPCVTPAPTPSAPKVSSKSSKGKTVKNTTTQASKASPIPKPQQKPQEDEHTTQRIFDILAEYAEQLRNSPDLNNKPAPRRRSNPPTNPNQNSKRKKNSSSKKSGQCSSMVSEVDVEDHRTVGSEDSSCGVVQISVQEEEQPHIQSVTTESNDSTSGSRQLILTDASNNQTRNLIIADSSVGEALKMPNTAVLVPGNYIMPVSMVKGGQQIAVVSGGSKILATVPARSGPNMLLFQSFLNQNRNKAGVPTVKYSTIQPISGISSQSLAGVSGQPPVILPPNSHNLTAVTLGQPLTLKKLDESDRVNSELLLTISQPRDNGNSAAESGSRPDSTNAISSTVNSSVEMEETIIHTDSSSEKVFHTYQNSIGGTTPIATPVIAQTSCVKEEENVPQNSITLNITPDTNKNEPGKTLERVQSVLVTACTSNGPMLSHTPPRYRKPSESSGTNNEPSNKEEFLHNGEKPNNNEQKQFQGNATYFHNKTKKSHPPRLDREIHQLCLQRKQAALERELRLQKSLSEECEDLGVDEPSTSDLFPEADILFDSNHSPSFDQSSQDLVKRGPPQEAKEENKSGMTLFSDDDNSSSLRTDFLFESVGYQPSGAEMEYEQNQQLTNGQSSASNQSASSCEDQTLLPSCASMSDVTLNSPVSPYNEHATSLNKCKFKYSNRKKNESNKQTPSETWAVEVSSSEDTTGSTELGKYSSHSPESCTNKHGNNVQYEDELSDGSYKVVRVAISKSDLLKDEESCEELHCEDACSPSGRGARRSVKKMCSCCNGSQDGGASRKRPASRPHTPAPHKKAFLNKKR